MKLITSLQPQKNIRINIGIRYLFICNKQTVLERIRNSHSSNNYIKNNICDIFGLEDFDICFKNLKRAIQNVAFNEVNLTFCNEKIPLELRFHQDMITYKQMKRIECGEKSCC
jgi:hypothetical protein